MQGRLGRRSRIARVRVAARGQEDAHDLRTVREVARPVGNDVQRCPPAMPASERTHGQPGIRHQQALERVHIAGMDGHHQLISCAHLGHARQIAGSRAGLL